VIWTGLVVLVMLFYLDITGGRSDLGLISTIFFALLSALVLRSSAQYDSNKENGKLTLIFTILFLLNAFIFGPLVARNITEAITFSLILFGPGTFLLIPASILQIQQSKK